LAFKPSTTKAGEFESQLGVTITRAQQQQYLSGITTALPPGLLAVIAGVPECPAAQATSGQCPAGSRIGSTMVLAGSGSHPLSQPGAVYLTGPYKGAPFGLSIVVPAIAGPFNLGTVVVRGRIEVDRNDAHLTIVTDPLPQIVGGIPLRIRTATVTVNRPNFTVNPTNCSPLKASGLFTSTQSATVIATAPFQATGCGSLPFTPKLSLALTGTGQTTPGKHPNLISDVTSAGLGQANVKSAMVTLPLSMALDPNNSSHVCAVKQAKTDSCPADTIVGSATAVTPLLATPLSGPAYLVQGIRYVNGQPIRTTPALLVTLRGQVALDLHAQTTISPRLQLVTTFNNTPDAALSSFKLEITGGPKGILVVTGNKSLCAHPQVAPHKLVAWNGATQSGNTTISTPACGG
jgi:hypothetical protein